MPEPIEFKTTMIFAYGEPLEVAPGVLRLVANNPGPFTFHGTNTYLVGTRELAIIDPGPADEAHFDAIVRAAAGRPITHIFITHTHRDHTDGLERLRTATRATVAGHGRAALKPGDVRTSPSGSAFIDVNFRPDLVLGEGDVVAGTDWTLEALFTPGHAPDHLCFALREQNVLFSGDHVMGWNTSVIAPPEGNMRHYLESLARLIGRSDTLYLPGHGGRIEQPHRTVNAYLVHRRWREQAILDAIRAGNATIPQIVALVYQGLDARLLNAASLSVLAHVEHLVERGLVRWNDPTTLGRVLSAV
jgi:glyoxylase-like metal-dependent hydrolase (beta-lactamase superfamily II)